VKPTFTDLIPFSFRLKSALPPFTFLTEVCMNVKKHYLSHEFKKVQK